MTEFQSDIVFLINLASGLMMTGIIWMVQVVQYPLFLKLTPQELFNYHTVYTKRITYVVLPLMFAELISSGLSAIYSFKFLPLMIFGFVLATWLSTFILSVPLHQKLSNNNFNDFSEEKIHDLCHKLIATNWPRTVLWSLKSLLLILYYPFPI